MPPPKVSVIMLTFEQSDIMNLALDALSLQTFKGRWELLVCDDGSSSGDVRSLLLKHSIADKIDLRYLWQPHIGRRAARSRNNGIRCAQGEILVFIDGDCIVTPDFIEKHVDAHSERETIYCGSRHPVFLAPALGIPTTLEEFLSKITSAPPGIDYSGWQTSVFEREPWRACMGCNLSVPRSAVVWFNEFFIGWGAEDIEFACRLEKRHSFQITKVPHTEVYTIERTEVGTYSPIRPSSHEDICRCLQDLFHLEWMYPDVDTSNVLGMIRHFDYSKELSSWVLASKYRRERYPTRALRLARRWFSGSHEAVVLRNLNCVRPEKRAELLHHRLRRE